MKRVIAILSLFSISLFTIVVPSSTIVNNTLLSTISSRNVKEEGVAVINNDPLNETKMRDEEIYTPIELSVNSDTNIKFEILTPGISVDYDESNIDNSLLLKEGRNIITLTGFDITKENNIDVQITSDKGLSEQYTLKTKVVPHLDIEYSTLITESDTQPGKIIPLFKFDVEADTWDAIQLNRRVSSTGYFDTEKQILNSGNETEVTLISGNSGSAGSPSIFQNFEPNQQYDIQIEIFYGLSSNAKALDPLKYDIYSITDTYTAGKLQVVEPTVSLNVSDITGDSASIAYEINNPVSTSDIAAQADIKRLELINKTNNEIVWSSTSPKDIDTIKLDSLESYKDYSFELKGYYDEIPFMEDQNEGTIETKESTFSEEVSFKTLMNTDQTLPPTNPPTIDNNIDDGNSVWLYVGISIFAIIVAILLVMIGTVLIKKKR